MRTRRRRGARRTEERLKTAGGPHPLRGFPGAFSFAPHRLQRATKLGKLLRRNRLEGQARRPAIGPEDRHRRLDGAAASGFQNGVNHARRMELVPLGFIHEKNALYNFMGARPGASMYEDLRLVAVARLFLRPWITNIPS